MHEVGELLEHYRVLLDLYTELESLSLEICRFLESGRPLTGIVSILSGKKRIIERIEQESRVIAVFKKTLRERNLISDEERLQVRSVEDNLTDLVNRVVEQGEKNFELIATHGVNVSRR